MSAAMNVEVDDDDGDGDDEEAKTLLVIAMLRCGVVVVGAMNACAKEYIPMVMTSWKIG